MNALELLKKEHDDVKAAFKKFQNLGKEDYAKKKTLADKICEDLSLHAKVEEAVFYPVFRETVKDDDQADEAKVEHDTAKYLIGQIKAMNAEDQYFDGRMKVLSELIDHHVEEEEEEMFPALKKTDVDLDELGEKLAAKKKALS